MSVTVLIVNGFALVCLIAGCVKDLKKTKKALLVALKSFIKLVPVVLIIILLIGIVFAFLPPERVSRLVGDRSGFLGIIGTAIIGSILHIPAITSFPLAASLLERGASISIIAVFITTLTMVGMVTFPLEIKELGKKMALLRNGLSFVIALAIALIMGVLL